MSEELEESEFSFYEMQLNQAVKGKIVYYEPEDKWVTIDHVKYEPKTKTVLVYGENEDDSFSCHRDDVYPWKVTKALKRKKPNKKRNRSKKEK
ncbi:MAG: hypothetical protein ACTSPB_04525 [Candidatus Thorarchaeota archaeon]